MKGRPTNNFISIAFFLKKNHLKEAIFPNFSTFLIAQVIFKIFNFRGVVKRKFELTTPLINGCEEKIRLDNPC